MQVARALADRQSQIEALSRRERPDGEREPAAEILSETKDLYMQSAQQLRSISDRHAQTQGARQAPRCRHIKANGEPCRAAADRGQDLCYFHQSARAPEKPERLPVLEDANAIQVALMIVMDGLYRYYIPHKTAALLLYGLQIAAANLRHLQLAPASDPE